MHARVPRHRHGYLFPVIATGLHSGKAETEMIDVTSELFPVIATGLHSGRSQLASLMRTDVSSRSSRPGSIAAVVALPMLEKASYLFPVIATGLHSGDEVGHA